MYRLLTLPARPRVKWVVLGCWLAVLFAAAPFGSQLFDVAEDTATSYLPRDAEATRVVESLQSFPHGETYPLLVVYQRPGGVTGADADRAAADLQRLKQRYAPEHDAAVMPSADGQALLFQLPISTRGSQDASDVLIEAVREARGTVGATDGDLAIRVAGPAAITADSLEVFDDLEVTLVLVPVLVVAVLLLLIYRSPVLFLLPLLTVVVANQFASAVVYGLVRGDGLTLSSMAASVLGILIYGASTNYALLIVARYREELGRHEDRHEAMRQALRRAGPAVLASGATVIVGLSCLIVADLNSTRSLGPVGVVAISCAMLALLTLLPALLVILGRWLFWPFVPRPGRSGHDGGRGWRRVGTAIAGRPRLTWIATALVVGIGAIGILSLNTPQQTLFRSTPDSVAGQEIIAQHYPAGATRPLEVVAQLPHAREVAAVISGAEGVADLQEVGRTADQVAWQVTLTATPASQAEYDGIDRLRERLRTVDGAAAAVGGSAAVERDLDAANTRDALLVIPLALLAILAVLVLLLRALVAPLLLVATQLLSFGAAFGISLIVFENGFGWHGQDASLPVLAFVFLIALGVDYSIFLLTRVREEARQAGTRDGTIRGLAVTGGVITSAGVVLAATFAVLASLPTLMVAQLGFVVVVGILIDAFVVRSVLVPALAIDLGRWTWWPGELSRAAGGGPRRPRHVETAAAPAGTGTSGSERHNHGPHSRLGS